MKAQYTEEQIEQILSLYKSGLGCKAVGEKTGFGRKAIFNLIKKLVPDKRGNSEANRITMGVASIREDAFDILSPEALYWIGFLYADGGIEKATTTIALGSTDKEHLEKYSKFLGGNLKVNTYKNSNRSLQGYLQEDGIIHRVAFRSKKIHSKLIELGFTSNKSTYILPNPLLISSRDFWRGVIDGDGWICTNKRKRVYDIKFDANIGLSGTELTNIEFINFINNSGIQCNSTPRKDSRGNVWKVDIHCEIAKQVMNLLYQNSTVYLERKYQTYLEILKSSEKENIQCLELTH